MKDRVFESFSKHISASEIYIIRIEVYLNQIVYATYNFAKTYVNSQLTQNRYTTYYCESDRGAEVDFLIQRGGKIIPIEVKSANNTRAKSLKVYMDTYQPDYAIKLSAKNFGFEDDKKTVPLVRHS